MTGLLVPSPTGELSLDLASTDIDFAHPLTRTEALGGHNICGIPCNPDKARVIRETVQNQGLIRRMAEEPAKAASRIGLFPQFENKNMVATRADPNNSLAEKIAWRVFRQISEKNGSRRRLCQQIHKVLYTYGHGWGLTLTDVATGTRYLKCVPFHTVKAGRSRNQNVYEWTEFENKPPRVLPMEDVKYLSVSNDLGYTGDHYSIFDPMVNTIVTWTIVWAALTSAARSSLFSAGLLWAPEGDDGKSWVKEWTWLVDEVTKKITANPSMLSKILPHPVSSEIQPKHVDFGESIQENILKFELVCRDSLASMMPNAPMKQIIEGEGAGSQWASTLLLREVLNGYGKPQLQDVVIPALTEWKYHAMLADQFKANNISMDVGRWSMGTNILTATVSPENPAVALQTYSKMGTTRLWVIEQQGGTEADLLPLPEGVTEHEHWQEANAIDRRNAVVDADTPIGEGAPPSDTENNASPNERGANNPTDVDSASVDRDPWMDPLWDAA